jgi:hypothetical protein
VAGWAIAIELVGTTILVAEHSCEEQEEEKQKVPKSSYSSGGQGGEGLEGRGGGGAHTGASGAQWWGSGAAAHGNLMLVQRAQREGDGRLMCGSQRIFN